MSPQEFPTLVGEFEFANSNTDISCESCFYFKQTHRPDGGERARGECRRYAPEPMLLSANHDRGINITAMWPEVAFTDYCGEWKSK